MILKKVSGKTLEEARSRAIEKYGNQFVIIETSDETQAGSAFITIAIEPETKPAERNPVKKEKEESTSFVKPLLHQVEQLFESGSETLSSLKNISLPSYLHSDSENRNSKDPAGAKKRNKSTPGVSYIKSAPDSKITQQDRIPSKNAHKEDFSPGLTPTGFREHFKRKPEKKKGGQEQDLQMTKLYRRLELLENMVRKFADDQSEYSEIPLYRYLREKRFTPEFLLDWFDQPAHKTGIHSDIHSFSERTVFSRIEEYFDSRDPLSEARKHLFTSFPGVNISKIVSAIADHCRMSGYKFNIGLLFSDSFESDDQSIQLMDSFKGLNTQCFDIVTHRDWQNFQNQSDEETYYLLVTLPLPFELDKVDSCWSHFNRVLGEYHSVKHHFISHSLHNPAEIISMLPHHHAFKPDYITLTNLEMCQANYGKLTDYKEKAEFDFGFFHKAGKPLTEPFGKIEQKLSTLILQSYHPPVNRQIKKQKVAGSV